MAPPVIWKLHCKHCDWAPLDHETMDAVQRHFVNKHETDNVELNLIPHCPHDFAKYEMSESGDSGQCPKCGRFDILRVPEEYL